MFQTNAVRLLPYDFTDKLGFDKNLTAAQALDARSAGGTRGLHSQIVNLRTVIPYIDMQDDDVREIILKPVELGFTKPIADNGLPHPADEENTQAIFNKLCELSTPYGTSLRLENGNIIVDL